MIPSCPNVLSIPTKHVVVNCLAFFPGNCLNLAANVFFFFFFSLLSWNLCQTLCILKLPQMKLTRCQTGGKWEAKVVSNYSVGRLFFLDCSALRRRLHDPWKRLELLVQRQRVTSQKTCIFSNPSVRISAFAPVFSANTQTVPTAISTPIHVLTVNDNLPSSFKAK